jgi:hypothetical protein
VIAKDAEDEQAWFAVEAVHEVHLQLWKRPRKSVIVVRLGSSHTNRRALRQIAFGSRGGQLSASGSRVRVPATGYSLALWMWMSGSGSLWTGEPTPLDDNSTVRYDDPCLVRRHDRIRRIAAVSCMREHVFLVMRADGKERCWD